jgi:GR25 family glycosyltransferase involved in LPS biosynthesis
MSQSKYLLSTLAYLPFLFLTFTLPISATTTFEETPTVAHLRQAELTELSSGIELVDCIYVINLEKRPEKWERVDTLLRQDGIFANRFNAIDGWAIPKSVQKELAGPYPVRMLPGEIGCLLSHISVIKDALDRNFNVVWIFEDDFECVEPARAMVPLIKQISEIDPNWDILYTDVDSKNSEGIPSLALGSDYRPDRKFIHPDEYYLARTSISKDLMQIRQRYGMYSFLVSRKGLQKIYHYFSHVYLWTAVDIDIHYIPSIRQYSAKRDIVSIWTHSPFSDTKEKVNE